MVVASHHRMRNDHAVLPFALIGAGITAAAGFALIARAVDRHETRSVDGRARKRFPKRRRPITRQLATAIGPLGKWWGQMPIAAAASALAWRDGGPAAGAPIAAASATAATLAWALERWMPQREPPPGRHSPTEPAFPSGHALQTTAVAWTIAYVYLREHEGRAGALLPFAVLVPLASGLAKMYLDRHWLTDVLGGYVAGAAIAAPAAAAYEIARPRLARRHGRVRALLGR
jgi:membrane-associated phospholipid phosphatase